MTHKGISSVARYRTGRRSLVVGAVTGAAALALGLPTPTASANTQRRPPTPSRRTLFVDPVHGDDTRLGDIPRAPASGRGSAMRHGPLKSLKAAVEAAYSRAADLATLGEDGDVTIWAREGTFRLSEPLMLAPHGTPLTINLRAYPGERPVLSGSVKIIGWQPAQLNGVTVWKTIVPEVQAGTWYFRQLFVDGRARPRPRLPKTVNETLEQGHLVTDPTSQFYSFQPGTDSGTTSEDRTFVYRPGDIEPSWHNLTDIDVIAMRDWYDERAPIESVDASSRQCRVAFRPYPGKPWAGRVYYVENVLEALADPGEWYLDHGTGELYYRPKPGESIGSVEFTAPRTRHLLCVEGSAGDQASNIAVSGLAFEESSWDYWKSVLDTGQAAAPTVGMIIFRHASDCSLADCVVRSPGEYGISVEEDCQRIKIIGNEVSHPGSGGIKASSYPNHPGVGALRTDHLVITDNHIHDTGRVFHLAAGILTMIVGETTVSHNHVHDLYYTGISMGFSHSFDASTTQNNTVAYNKIHDMAKGLLADLGGIYTLGNQPGTTVHHNLVYNVTPSSHTGFHGAGLYADQGSSNIVWSDNVIHHVPTGYFSGHGVDNVVRNNIFAKSTEATLLLGNDRNGSPDPQAIVTNNLMVVDQVPLLMANKVSASSLVAVSDNNLLWNTAGTIDGGTEDVGRSGAATDVIKIVKAADGTDVPNASVHLDPGGTPIGEFAFAALDTPVTLAANTAYFVMMKVTSGGDKWYDATPVQTTAAAAVVGSVYVSHTGLGYATADNEKCFGPINFRYLTAGSSDSVEYVTGATLTSALRNNYGGFVGVQIVVGPEPIVVTELGKLVVSPPLPNWWEQWQAAGLDAHSVIVDPEFVDYDADDYRIRGGSPALQAPVSFQRINLSSIGPRLRS